MTICQTCKRNEITCECHVDQPKTDAYMLYEMSEEFDKVAKAAFAEYDLDDDTIDDMSSDEYKTYVKNVEHLMAEAQLKKYYELMSDSTIPKKLRAKFAADTDVKEALKDVLP